MVAYIGEIRMFAGNFPPNGWAFCDGQPLSISENEALYQLIGDRYGGDGESTFNLPNLCSRFPIHMGNGPGGVYQLGDMAGTEQETLSIQQIPSHSHPLTASTSPGTSNNPGQSVLAASPSVSLFTGFSGSAQMSADSITPAGGSQPHENVQPFLCVNFIISLFGIFPSQT